METPRSITTPILLSAHAMMVRIRRFEERVAELLEQNIIKCPTHLYIGQEAIATGVCAALKTDDYVWGNHRSHGHYLAKGGDMKLLMAEMYGKKTGCSGGRGGSMHLIATDIGILGTVPMVGATIPIAVGAALGAVLQQRNRVSVAFFGDGATEEGSFHESLNFASLNNLPVLFVCENNLFSSHLPIKDRRPSDNIYESALAHAMPGVRIDGNNFAEVFSTTKAAVERARAGDGPTLIECRTYRWRGHVGPKWDLDVGIRDEAELATWMAHCPIKQIEKSLLDDGILNQTELAKIYADASNEVEEAIEFADSSPFPDPSELMDHVVKP